MRRGATAVLQILEDLRAARPRYLGNDLRDHPVYILRGCKPKFPESTLLYELFRAFATTAGELGGLNIIKPLNVASFRRTYDLLGDVQRWVSWRYNGVTTEFFQLNGLEHLWIKPRDKPDVKQRMMRVVVLYYHGGAYIVGSPRFYAGIGMRLRYHVAKAIAKLTDGEDKGEQPVQVELLLANYRKIPEHQFPVPVDDALIMYDYLVTEEKVPPSQIIISGDSTGGRLAISTLLRLRNVSRVMPVAAIVICPWVNMLADHEKSEHCHIPTSTLNSV